MTKVKKEKSPWYLDAIQNDVLSKISLVPVDQFHQIDGIGFKIKRVAHLQYNSNAAFAYAQSYCDKSDNSCGKLYTSDCAHFMSHCLAAGGVLVKGSSPDASCPHGLCIRAEELAAAFYNSTTMYDNVKQLNSYSDGKKGDYGFLRTFIGKSHAFLLNGTPDFNSGPVYAHTNPHCGDKMDTIRIYFGAYYRILS